MRLFVFVRSYMLCSLLGCDIFLTYILVSLCKLRYSCNTASFRASSDRRTRETWFQRWFRVVRVNEHDSCVPVGDKDHPRAIARDQNSLRAKDFAKTRESSATCVSGHTCWSTVMEIITDYTHRCFFEFARCEQLLLKLNFFLPCFFFFFFLSFSSSLRCRLLLRISDNFLIVKNSTSTWKDCVSLVLKIRGAQCNEHFHSWKMSRRRSRALYIITSPRIECEELSLLLLCRSATELISIIDLC